MKNRAEIITIGDEILIGQIVDTNSAWIAKELEQIGINIYQITSISDNKKHILQALADAQNRSNIVIITGGLGPTKDDITKNVLCQYFDTKLVFSQETIDNILAMFSSRGLVTLNDNNKEQAMVPESCTILKNTEGTAPGMYFEKEQSIFFSIPGVPFEMKQLMTTQIIPILKQKFVSNAIVHRVVMTHGIFEARMAEILEEWEEGLKHNNIKLAYLPQPGIIRLRLSTEGEDKMQLNAIIEKEIDKLKKIIPDNIYGYDEELIEEAAGKLLKEKNKTIATAESCTGGNIAAMLTSVAGSSAYFIGSVVAYSNSIKENILQVEPSIIEQNGVVSKPVVEAMSKGLLDLYKSDYAIAVSGIAGPDGGTDEKPVGTIWISISSANKTISEKFLFGNNRQRNIRKTSVMALTMLMKFVDKN